MRRRRSLLHREYSPRETGLERRAPAHNGRPEDRCQELGCAYPSAVAGGFCSYHWLVRSGRIPASRPKFVEHSVTIGRGWA